MQCTARKRFPNHHNHVHMMALPEVESLEGSTQLRGIAARCQSGIMKCIKWLLTCSLVCPNVSLRRLSVMRRTTSAADSAAVASCRMSSNWMLQARTTQAQAQQH